MLSPGQWHKLVPTGQRENLAFRKWLALKAAGSADLRRGLVEVCRQDILFWINTFVWQFNPKKKKGEQQVGPFICWPYQEAMLLATPEAPYHGDAHGIPWAIDKGLLWCYEHDESSVIEKSREQGVTWTVLIPQVWLCRFHRYTQILNVSRDADSVDCKSPDSLFWKIRFIHEHLPDWLLGPVVDNKMYFEYPEAQSYNTGEASTGSAGVGGRAGLIFLDEFSKVKEDVEVRQRTAGTADCRVFNSTHGGTSTEFFRLTQTPEINKIQVHWTQHPEKVAGLYRSGQGAGGYEVLDRHYEYPPDYKFVTDGKPTGGPHPGVRSPWYDRKSVEIGSDRGVAVELDINPAGSVSQFFDSVKIRHLRLTYAQEPVWRGELSYDAVLGTPLELVANPQGHLRLWIHPKEDGKVPLARYVIGCDPAQGTGATPSCLHVANAETHQQVGEYANAFIEPQELAPLFVALARHFRGQDGEGANLIWEYPGPGLTLGKHVLRLGYRNIYYRENELRGFERKPSETPGWHSSPNVKLHLLEEFRGAVQGQEYLVVSDPCLKESLDFRYMDNGFVEHSGEASPNDPSGARVNHGDKVMPAALAWKVVKALGIKAKKEVQDRGPKPDSLAGRRSTRENTHDIEENWAYSLEARE